jgi:hypothetical protein
MYLIFKLKLKMLIHRSIRIKIIFWYTPATAFFILNLMSIQHTLCLLLSLLFHSRNLPPSARDTPLPSCSSILSHDLRWRVVLTSLKTIRQGKVMLSRRRPSQAKEIYTRKKKKKSLPQPTSQPNLWTQQHQQPQRPISLTSFFLCSRRAAADRQAGLEA